MKKRRVQPPLYTIQVQDIHREFVFRFINDVSRNSKKRVINDLTHSSAAQPQHAHNAHLILAAHLIQYPPTSADVEKHEWRSAQPSSEWRKHMHVIIMSRPGRLIHVHLLCFSRNGGIELYPATLLETKTTLNKRSMSIVHLHLCSAK
jgi:hypothetical protein